MIISATFQLSPLTAFVIDAIDKICIGGQWFDRDLKLCDSRWFDSTAPRSLDIQAPTIEGNAYVPTRYALSTPRVLAQRYSRHSAGGLGPFVAAHTYGSAVAKWNGKLLWSTDTDVSVIDENGVAGLLTGLAATTNHTGFIVGHPSYLVHLGYPPGASVFPCELIAPDETIKAQTDVPRSAPVINKKGAYACAVDLNMFHYFDDLSSGVPKTQLSITGATGPESSPYTAENYAITSDGKFLVGHSCSVDTGIIYAVDLTTGTSQRLPLSYPAAIGQYPTALCTGHRMNNGKDRISVFVFPGYYATATANTVQKNGMVINYDYDPNTGTFVQVSSPMYEAWHTVMTQDGGDTVYACHASSVEVLKWMGDGYSTVEILPIAVASAGVSDDYIFLIDTSYKMYALKLGGVPSIVLTWSSQSLLEGETAVLAIDVQADGKPARRIVRLVAENAKFTGDADMVEVDVNGRTTVEVKPNGVGTINVFVAEVRDAAAV